MENASKALIIAGAILLSILIIGLGMYIYGQASGAMQGANLNAEQVQAYNSKFQQYEGKNKSGTQVRSLLNTIKNHNNINVDDESLQINVTIDSKAYEKNVTSDAINSIKAGKNYNVVFGLDETGSGYINSVTIEAAKSDSGT